jgi:hypothetical protein
VASVFRGVKLDNGLNVFLSPHMGGERFKHNGKDGEEEYVVISQEAPLYKALLGKREGDVVVINYTKTKIKEIVP